MTTEQIKEFKEKVSGTAVVLTFPSVIPLNRTGMTGCYLALWMDDGIPQHCQVQKEEDGWVIIANRMRI